jgi:streptogramin lyase
LVSGPNYQTSAAATFPLGITFASMVFDGSGHLWGVSSNGVIDEINVNDGSVMQQYVVDGTGSLTGLVFQSNNVWAAFNMSFVGSRLVKIPAP